MTLKQLLVVSLFCLVNPFSGSTQYNVDNEYREELEEIILNYHRHGFERFNVDVSKTLFYRGVMSTLFKYRQLNDSVISEKYLKEKAQYLIDDNSMTQLDIEEDSTYHDYYPNRDLQTKTDSAGVNTVTQRFFENGRISIRSIIKTSHDSITNADIKISKYYKGDKRTSFKSVTTYISEDIVLYKYYKLIEGDWKMTLEKINLILHSQTEFTKTKFEKIYEFNHSTSDDNLINSSEQIVDNVKKLKGITIENNEKRTVTYYDNRGLIEKIVISFGANKESIFGRRKIVLRPLELN